MITRIFTAAVLIAIFLPLMLIGGWTVYLMVGVVGVLAHYELTSIVSKRIPIWLRVLIIFTYTVIAFLPFEKMIFVSFVSAFFLIVCAEWDERIELNDIMLITTICSFVSFCAHSFLRIGLLNNMYLIIITVITYMNDTGAYFAGNFIGNKIFEGKHRFNVRVSPKKTWEGTIGGFITSIITAIIFGLIYPELMGGMKGACIIGILFGICGTLGDLMFSLIKRHFNVKDYGSILPGHGGVLDRVDSLLVNFGIIMCVLQFIVDITSK